MVQGVWGKKIGMSQVFFDNKVVPVTAIDISSWRVVGKRHAEKDGHDAVQIGLLRNRYVQKSLPKDWLKQRKNCFSVIREVRLHDVKAGEKFAIGQSVDFHTLLAVGDFVDVVSKSKGCGFAGVYKRHGFGGAPKTHGSRMGRRPGSLGFMHACGKTIRGKKLGGHMGVEKMTMKGLQVVRILSEENVILVKGSVAGKAGSVVFVRYNSKQ